MRQERTGFLDRPTTPTPTGGGDLVAPEAGPDSMADPLPAPTPTVDAAPDGGTP